MARIFWINAASGVALLVSDISTFAVAPLFYIKLGVIALSLANLIAIRRVVFNGPSRTGPITPSARMLAVTSLVCMGGLGWLAARTGGARPLAGTVRVVFWGALAMGLTAAVGALFGTTAV